MHARVKLPVGADAQIQAEPLFRAITGSVALVQ
jgi:hypothetical protein